MSGFQLKRLGQVMEPEPGNPLEIENVLNPAAARGPDDLGLPERIDVYYGMADNRIGAARLDVPEYLPSGREGGRHRREPQQGGLRHPEARILK
jgi:hypothetical protein